MQAQESRLRGLFALALTLLGPPALTFGGDLNVAVSPGLDRAAKPGRWTFLKLSCSNQGDTFEGSAIVQGFSYQGTAFSETYEVPITLPRGSKKEFFVYFPCGARTSYWRLRLSSAAGRIVFEEKISSPTGEPGRGRFWYGDPGKLMLVRIAGHAEKGAFRVIATENNPPAETATVLASDLPDRWNGLDAASAVVARSEIFQGAMNERSRAMMEWVGSGGHLIVVANAADSGRFHPDWAKLFGVQLVTTVPFIPEPVFLARYGAPPANTLRANFEGQMDEVLAADEGGPLLARKRYGLGTITFAAVDILSPQWEDWKRLPAFWRDVLAVIVPDRSDQAPAYTAGGYGWHTQNIISSLRQIPELKPPSFAMLALYLGLYLFVLVVVNYLVLKRLDKREWSLFTFPAIAIVFGIGAYWSGYLLRGGTSVLHQVNLVELAAGQTQGVARMFVGFFSAVRQPRTLTFPRDSFPQHYAYNPNAGNPGERASPPLNVLETETPRATVGISVWTMRTFVADAPVRISESIRGHLVLSETNQTLFVDGWLENYLPVNLQMGTLYIGTHYVEAVAVQSGAKRIEIHEPAQNWPPNNWQGQWGTFNRSQANAAIRNWWLINRHEPGRADLVCLIDGELPGLGSHWPQAERKQETILAVRIPLATRDGERHFGPNWWEADIAKVESSQLWPANWRQRASFSMNRGSVTLRYYLLGHRPGKRLTRLSVSTHPPSVQTRGYSPQIQAGPPAFTAYNRRDGTWKSIDRLTTTELDGNDYFDEMNSTVEIKLDAGQGTVTFEPQCIRLTGEAE